MTLHLDSWRMNPTYKMSHAACHDIYRLYTLCRNGRPASALSTNSIDACDMLIGPTTLGRADMLPDRALLAVPSGRLAGRKVS